MTTETTTAPSAPLTTIEALFAAPPANPLEAFALWFADANAHEPMAEAMNLATLSPEGQPRSRMVLLKGVEDDGFVFYTNYESRKARDLIAEPRVGLTFHWKSLERQVHVEGRSARVDAATSDEYWATRPRGSQLGGWMSDQSRPIASREALEAKRAEVLGRFGEEGPVPRPPHWGGFHVTPTRVELWQGRQDRLHDRLVYTRQADGSWATERLQP